MIGSGFRPDGNAEPEPPLTLDQAQAAARVLQHEKGLGWKVWATTYPDGPRIVAQKWPPRDDDHWVVAPTLGAARKQIAEHEDREGV